MHAPTATAAQVVLLDDDGHAVGTRPESSVHDATTPLHLGMSVFLVDEADRVLLTRRAYRRSTFPGTWSSVGGHPAPGETLEDAARRRALREAGLRVQDVRVVLPAYRFQARRNGLLENEFCPVVVASVRHQVVTGHPDELDDADWVPWEDLTDRVGGDGPDVTPWCREQVGLLGALPGGPASWEASGGQVLPPALQVGAPVR
ncbi:isopentenyl-diphosphate Delta-isomerase [Angustibacter speluncae]